MILRKIVITFTDGTIETIYAKYKNPEEGIMEEFVPDIDIHYEIGDDDLFQLYDEFSNLLFITKWELIKSVKLINPYSKD